MTATDDPKATPEPGSLTGLLRVLISPHPDGFLAARHLFLRALGLVFFSVFYSYAFQIHGLIGEHGILPAVNYLHAAREQLSGFGRYFLVPTVFWFTNASRGALNGAIVAGFVASISLILNVAPRACVALCTALFLSIISVSSVFASYQSDGMLLEAGFLSLFLAPSGLRPGLGAKTPPSRIARFMLVWEWFRIYFESGVVKLASGDPEWRNLTALDHYYENGPLPTWIGWYVQHLPHAFHAFTTALVLAIELLFVWVAFAPRRYRVWLFVITTLLQLGIIATANYAFLNYLVLFLGVFLLDDHSVRLALVVARRTLARGRGALAGMQSRAAKWLGKFAGLLRQSRQSPPRGAAAWTALAVLVVAFCATVESAPLMSAQEMPPVLGWPAFVLAPFRFANGYGLFAVMTRRRFEIEFQGSRDGKTFLPYPFRYKPQDPKVAPRIYAPYQPRFEWNLWFASLGRVEQNRWVLRAAAALLLGKRDVLSLFAADPFEGERPSEVRVVIYRYWFSTLAEHHRTGIFWHRELLGDYTPRMHRSHEGNGAIGPKAVP